MTDENQASREQGLLPQEKQKDFDSKWLREDLETAIRENERMRIELEAKRAWECSEGGTAALFAALAAAQGEIESAAKHAKNPHFQSRYADLDAVWQACRGPLSTNKLSVVQLPSMSIRGGKCAVSVRTVLGHESGEWIASTVTMETQDFRPQTVGSAITYGRRYGLAPIAGVAPGDDDDGEGAEGRATGGTPPVQPRAPQGPPAKAGKQAPMPAQAANGKAAPKQAELPDRSRPATGAPMTLTQYEAIGAAFAATDEAEIPKVCKEVVGKDPPESAGPASGWTNEDAEKLLAHLGGAK